MAPSASLVVRSKPPRRASAANITQNKLKVQLKLSISRLRMVQQKDSAKAKQQRREMAQLLEVRRSPHLTRPGTAHYTTTSRTDITHAGRQNPIRTHTCRKHHPLRHYHRAPRDPRTLLRTPARPLPAARHAVCILHHTFYTARPRARRSRKEHHIRGAAHGDQGTAYRARVAGREVWERCCAGEYGGGRRGGARGEEVEGGDAGGWASRCVFE
jgi:hypothetical protein